VAYALKQEGSGRRVFVVSSDGEQDEGQVWEAYLFANHYRLDNLTFIIDANGIQQSGRVEKVLDLNSLVKKLLAFNLAVAQVEGNDFVDLDRVWRELAPVGYPKVLLCHTTPGKGVPLLENNYYYHAGQPTGEVWRQIWKAFDEENN
jgi:transketolase